MIQTPCFIFNEEIFVDNIIQFQRQLYKYNKNNILGYSFKTNALPYILNCVKQNNCYAEVVSSKEFNLAKKIGFDLNRIIYNGPIKTQETFEEALVGGAIVNLDSKREIEWLKNIDSEFKINVGIRINFDLEMELPNHTTMGDEGGRFGFCADNEELDFAIEKIRKCKNVCINCLHMHVSSKTRTPNVYRVLAQKACEISKKYGLKLTFIDIGGGFFGGNDNGEAYEKYINNIYSVLETNGMGDINLIVEPGASVVSTAFQYYMRVVDIKETTKNKFVVTDGSRLHVDPFWTKEKYQISLYALSKNTCPEQVICGFTCMEKDRLLKLRDSYELQEGDIICLDNVGSYTMCFNSMFIEYIPRVYVKKENKFHLVSGNYTIEYCLENNMLEVDNEKCITVECWNQECFSKRFQERTKR